MRLLEVPRIIRIGGKKEKIKRKGVVPYVATPLYFIEKTALQWLISAIAAAWFVNCA
jgi:hypothetical protein